MKWCFLVNRASFIIEFFGKLAYQIIKAGDEYIIVIDGKISEYSKIKYFPKNAKIFSEVDWHIKYYQKTKEDFQDLSWKEFFPEFDRFNRYKIYDFNYRNSVQIVNQSYQFANFILQKEKPDIVIAEVPSGIFNGIFYFLCKKYKITYFGLLESRVKDHFDVYDLDYTYSKYEKTFREIKETDISKDERKFTKGFIENFVSHKKLPPYMEYQQNRSALGEIGKLRDYLKKEGKMLPCYLRYFLKRRKFKPFDYDSEFLMRYIFHYPKEAIKARFRTWAQKSIFNSPNTDDKFFFFPLHLQPEASTSVQATYFCDQINTIKNSAFILPFPYKLYIKEHPSAVGTQPGNFYREIKEIPNTVLIAPNENVENLIKKSQGVITLTSTIGMEAALLGKPAYVLGNVFYQYHPLCRKVNSFEELKTKIEQDLAKKPVLKNLDVVNIRFVASYLRNIVSGDLTAAVNISDANNYEKIYKVLRTKFLNCK